jgi:hypothetical protein
MYFIVITPRALQAAFKDFFSEQRIRPVIRDHTTLIKLYATGLRNQEHCGTGGFPDQNAFYYRNMFFAHETGNNAVVFTGRKGIIHKFPVLFLRCTYQFPVPLH